MSLFHDPIGAMAAQLRIAQEGRREVVEEISALQGEQASVLACMDACAAQIQGLSESIAKRAEQMDSFRSAEEEMEYALEGLIATVPVMDERPAVAGGEGEDSGSDEDSAAGAQAGRSAPSAAGSR